MSNSRSEHSVHGELLSRLQELYPDRERAYLSSLFGGLSDLLQSGDQPAIGTPELWSERDVVLITYGDQVRSDPENPLRTLRRFLTDHGLFELISTLHLLPCFPYSSDDGFSVIDYLEIDPNLGNWDDVQALTEHGELMLDFVLNHISQHSQWFQNYLNGVKGYENYFIESDPRAELSMVTRPRSSPLLSEFDTARGKRWLWTTFGRDQVDLNYAEPAVLLAALEVIDEYVRRGARIIRLDAIAYLWKQLGTACIHLPQTHAVVKLIRHAVAARAPRTLVLTETNVPHDENISYFGDGDEAHMVYQFSLPPLLLDAILNEDALPLKSWLENLTSPPAGCTFFNFTASHDGVGVRPLEGRVDGTRLDALVEQVKLRGGLVGTRRRPDGSDAPYELNISYVDAVSDLTGNPERNAARFLATQAFAMALQGMPAIYFHSLVGTQNYLAGVKESGINRRINRRKFKLEELEHDLQVEGSLQQLIFAGMRHLLQVRIGQPAFHPDASQRYVESGSPYVVCFERRGASSGQSILVAANFDDNVQSVSLPRNYSHASDLLESRVAGDQLALRPAQVVWLARRN